MRTAKSRSTANQLAPSLAPTVGETRRPRSLTDTKFLKPTVLAALLATAVLTGCGAAAPAPTDAPITAPPPTTEPADVQTTAPEA